jgi:prophage regulatory protein
MYSLELKRTIMNSPALPAALHRIRDVMHITCLGKTAIYGLVKAGDFPRPVKIGRRAVAWRHEDIQKWISTRVDALSGPTGGKK